MTPKRYEFCVSNESSNRAGMVWMVRERMRIQYGLPSRFNASLFQLKAKGGVSIEEHIYCVAFTLRQGFE